jgi:hypothetical protein
MAATSTERSRRHRAHGRGDHSLCDRRRGCVRGERPAAAPAPNPYMPLSERSRALHDELAPGADPLARLLLTETLRIADRLDHFDQLIAGKSRRGEWLRLTEGDHGETRVVVDDLLAEARQHGTTFKAMIAELMRLLPTAPATPAPKAGLADLSARIAARRNSPPPAG